MSDYVKYLQRISGRQSEPQNSIARSILIGLGGFLAIGAGLYLLGYFAAVFFFVLKAAALAGIVGGAGLLGYRALTRQKILPRAGERAEKSHKQLPSSRADYDRKMRELEAIERRLDAEISKHS